MTTRLQVPAAFVFLAAMLIFTLIFASMVVEPDASLAEAAAASEVPAAEPGQGKAPAGTYESADLTIDFDNIATWRQRITYPEAAFIKLHFDQLDLMPGDVLVVSDASGGQMRAYPGTGFNTDGGPGLWALSVLGDTAVVELQRGRAVMMQTRKEYGFYDRALSGAPASELGVHIDRYARGFPEAVAQMLNPDSTCGTNQRTDVACYAGSHPTEFNTVNAVAKVLRLGSSHCTSWRVSPENRMMTNEHCISSQAELNLMEFWFNYQRPQCQSGDPAGNVTVVAGDTFLIDDYTLDFALYTVDNFPSIQGFGYLTIDPRTPVLGEEIYIGQHGAGNPKEFGIESDFNPPNNLCAIDDAIRNGRGANTDTGYYCDTIGGSSGSPVLARANHQVIAIHHFGTGGAPCTGTTMNGGVRMDLIWPIIAPFFSSTATLSNSTIDALPGATVTHTLELHNPLSADTFTVTMAVGAWPATMISPASLAVGQGMTGTVEVVVDLPHLEALHGSDTFTVTAQSANDPATLITGIGTTNQVTNPSLVVSSPQGQAGQVGEVLTYTVVVTNTGDYTDTFDLMVSGNMWPTSPAATDTGQLGAGEAVALEIYVTVAAGANQDTAAITFTSSLDNGVTAVVDLVTQLEDFSYMPFLVRE